MDRFLDLINSIFSLSDIYLHIMDSDYWLFCIVPAVIIGIFIITAVIRLVVRQVHN